MKKIVFVFMTVLFAGCAQHTENIQPQNHYTGTKAELPLGTVLGCSQQLVQYGFTKEQCGSLWGMQIEIEVHDVRK